MKRKHQATHPMTIVAATATTIAALAATAHFTGLLPSASTGTTANSASLASATLPAGTAAAMVAATPAPAASHAAAPAPKPRPAAVAKPRPAVVEAAPQTVSYDDAPVRPADWRYANERNTVRDYPANDNGIDIIPARPSARAAAPACYDCGTIEAVREISTPAEGSGLGAIAGGVLGGLLGNQVGQGKGSQVAAVVGALGGAYAGHQAEKHFRAEKQLEVTVRLDDGSTRTALLSGPSRWRAGDRVRLSNGNLLPV